MGFIDRLLGRRRPHREILEETDRERVEGRMDDWKQDAFVAGGGGAGVPVLPETTPEGLYEDFEREAERPPDEAP